MIREAAPHTAPRAELFRALGVLSESPEPGHAPLWEALGLAAAVRGRDATGREGVPDAADFTDLFVFHLYPYASVYLGADGMLGGDARDRIAGFWRALRLVPSPEPDHLAALLGLYAGLIDRETQEDDPARRLSCRHARAALLSEHLLSWLPPYLDRVEAIAPAAYRGWAALLRDSLVAEAASLGVPGARPAHFGAAPPLPDPRRAGSQAFVAGLLAPARCGMILTRADFVRAARRIGVGVRMGERKFVLAALLSQAPAAVLEWLAGEAAACAARCDVWRGIADGITGFWRGRAASTAALLRELHDEARQEAAP